MPAKRSFTLALALLLVAAIPARATSAPTITVIDVAPGAGDSYAMDTGAPGDLNGYLYFQADDGTNGMELWRSNGTSTVLVEDICVGGNDSSPTDFTQLGTYLYFRADDCLSGRELWRTNGTTTERVLDINPGNSGQDSSTPRCFAEFNGYLYFQAEDGTSGRELWRTNGTITEMVENMYNGSGSSNPNWLTVSGSYLYFQAESVTDGVEIWRTNGITTTQVADINVGASSSSPQHLFSFDGFVYFQAEDLVTGAELWRTDGTTTTQLQLRSSCLEGPSKLRLRSRSRQTRAPVARAGPAPVCFGLQAKCHPSTPGPRSRCRFRLSPPELGACECGQMSQLYPAAAAAAALRSRPLGPRPGAPPPLSKPALCILPIGSRRLGSQETPPLR